MIKLNYKSVQDCLTHSDEKLTFSFYHLGDVKKAEFYTDKIKKQTPAYLVNKAFFSILRKDYKNSIEFYSLLRNKEVSEEWINNIISFLEDRFKEQPLELAFKYAIAILFYNHIDKQKGRKQLLELKRCSSNMEKYSLYNSKIDFILINNKIKKKINIKKKKKRKSKRKRKR